MGGYLHMCFRSRLEDTWSRAGGKRVSVPDCGGELYEAEGMHREVGVSVRDCVQSIDLRGGRSCSGNYQFPWQVLAK